MKIRGVGAELFHADGETHGRPDMTKLIVALRNVAYKQRQLRWATRFNSLSLLGK